MKFENWRIDTDGFLRVTARVLREGIFPYSKSDLPPELQATFHPDQNTINQYIPASEFTIESLSSLEGKPVVIHEHEWRDADNTHSDGLTVGSAAGAPYVLDGGILVDLLITHAETIDRITAKELVEVSAGYDGDLVMGPGAFGDEQFDATQTNLRFNHVLLLPLGEGRCGYEVRIINQKDKETHMEPVHLRIGNREYKFSNAEDAEEGKKLAKDEASEATTGMVDQKQLDDAIATIVELKAALAKLEDPEAQEAEAQELLNQKEDEEAVKKTDVKDEDKEKVGNAMKGCNRKDRVKILMTHVLNAKGMPVEGLDDSALHVLFKFHALNSKATIKAAEDAAAEAAKKGYVVGAHHVVNSTGKKEVHPLFAGMKK